MVNYKISASKGSGHVRGHGHGQHSKKLERARRAYHAYTHSPLSHCKPKRRAYLKWAKKQRKWDRAMQSFDTQLRAVHYGYKKPGPAPTGTPRDRGLGSPARG